MLEPIGQATEAAQEVFGDMSTWANVGSAAQSVSGAFEFPSVAEIDAILTSWKERQQSIAKRGDTLEFMVNSVYNTPANDDSTIAYMGTWGKSLGQLRDQHKSMLDYVDNYIQKLEAAKRAKQTGEDENTDAVRKSAGGVTQ
ncbi:hypothetical protein [Amycolatopsis alkalitolerans]|uniref:PE domain-containing protein n=1 Tax=Amycolatopsis alkalitolerans TaxID=2547244 RepID=A0A5C4LRZ1_9PSEU|nr:hypothetical protein [Amycolatopsis alkalitolerans]TNC21181.1 hypothetical protein FG385_29005 [Amycolatopsis alkalitolerans]